MCWLLGCCSGPCRGSRLGKLALTPDPVAALVPLPFTAGQIFPSSPCLNKPFLAYSCCPWHCFMVRKNSESDPSEAKRNRLVAKRNDVWKYYFVASLIVNMKSFIRLFSRINRKYGPI